MDVIKIAVLGIAGLMICIFVKETKPEYALYVSLATGICILVLATGKLTYLMEMIGNLKSYVPIDATYLNALLKMIGITYVGQFSAGICRDAGYSSIAGQIEIFAKLVEILDADANELLGRNPEEMGNPAHRMFSRVKNLRPKEQKIVIQTMSALMDGIEGIR